MIDSGGSKDPNYDIGKSTLFPYLLARKIKTIDYMNLKENNSMSMINDDFLFTFD